MRILYTRVAHQEAEREIEFNLDPFNQAKWVMKDDNISGISLDSTEELADFEYIRLLTFDTKVIEELWGAGENDLLDYIKDRTFEDNVIRSYETEVTLEGHRQQIPIHLKVHTNLDYEGTGFDATLYTRHTVYAEVECYEYLDDDEYRIYDAEQNEVSII
jgi:hypothetical protein